MTDWQIEKQVKYALLARHWEGNAAYEVVFASESVFVSVAEIEKALAYDRTPFAMIRPGEAIVDPDRDEAQDLLRFTFTVRVLAACAASAMGEEGLIGAWRAGATTTGQGSSQGRGLDEIEEEVRAAIRLMQPQNGIRIQFRGKSAVGATQQSDATHIVFRDLVFEAMGTADRDYEPPTNFRATGGAGSIALAWTNPPDRYDLYKIIIRRAAGAVAPTSVSGGTGVTLTNDTITATITRNGLDTSKSDSVAAGTYSYAFFVQYDESHNSGDAPTSAERTSVAATVLSVIAT